jgi:transposase
MQDALNQLAPDLKEVVIQILDDHKRVVIENQLLREALRLMRIEKYGPKSEKLSDHQLELLEGEISVTSAEVEAEAARVDLGPVQPRIKRDTQHPGRVELPAHLERREVKIPCAPQDCVCPICQGEKQIIGYDRSEELDVIPAHYFVKVALREKRACRHHPEGGVVTAPCASRLLPKSKLSDAMIVDVLVKKYGDHLPAYRQSMILERDAQIDLSRKTLIHVIMRAGESMEALIPALKTDLWEGGYIQADETRMPCQTREVRGRNHRAFMWEFGRPLGPVVFDFQMGRSRAGPEEFLRGYRGILQTDGYAAYDKLGDGIDYAACWAHVRREFHRAHKLQEKDPRPLEILETIGQLYDLEEQARKAGASHAQRLALRDQHSRPLIEQLQQRIIAIRAEADVLPASQLGKACKYAMKLWPRLQVFLNHGQLEIDNNWCENAIRPLAVGRKNWLHLGCEAAGPRVAAITSIFETCRRLDINVRTYLLDVLPRLPEWPSNRVAELSPMAWKSRQTS